MPSVRARKPTGSVFMAKRTREPYPPPPAGQRGPAADRGGPESSTRAFTCPRPVRGPQGGGLSGEAKNQ
jgi:hypothetical protein